MSSEEGSSVFEHAALGPSGWYRACLECLADLEHHAEHHGTLSQALAPWCKLCAAAAEALNAGERP